jgi:hypothetical protein
MYWETGFSDDAKTGWPARQECPAGFAFFTPVLLLPRHPNSDLSELGILEVPKSGKPGFG